MSKRREGATFKRRQQQMTPLPVAALASSLTGVVGPEPLRELNELLRLGSEVVDVVRWDSAPRWGLVFAVLPHPAGVTSTLTRRRGESDESLESRRKEHQELILFQRVRILWRG